MTGWTMYKWWEEKEEEKKWIQANAIANSWEGWVWATGKDKKMNELSQRFWHEIRGTIVQVLHLQPAPIKAVPSSRKPNLQCYFFFWAVLLGLMRKLITLNQMYKFMVVMHFVIKWFSLIPFHTIHGDRAWWCFEMISMAGEWSVKVWP